MDVSSKDFNLQKKLCLEKLHTFDKSRKGSIDKPIVELIEYINSLENYYTTSSCSGRIYLFTEADKKPDVKWLYVSHEKVNAKNIIEALKGKLPKQRIWLKQENLILHIACRTMDDANKILNIARNIGFRRSGIIADSNIIIVEICSTESVDVPVCEKGKLLVSKEYLKLLVKIANQKFMKGRKKLERLEEEIRKIK